MEMVNNSGEHRADRQPEVGSVHREQATPLDSFANEQLGDILQMERSVVHTGVTEPAAFSSAMKSWLAADGSDTVLEKFARRHDHQEDSQLTFRHVADLTCPLGEYLTGRGSIDQLLEGMDDLYKKALTLLVADRLTSICNRSEREVWDSRLDEEHFPAECSDFDAYDDELIRLLELFEEFTSSLAPHRQTVLWQQLAHLQVTNGQIVRDFQRRGVIDQTFQPAAPLCDEHTYQPTGEQVSQLIEQLIGVEFEASLIAKMELVEETERDAETILHDTDFSNGLVDQFPPATLLDELQEAATSESERHKWEHYTDASAAPETKQEFLQRYFERVADQAPEYAALLEVLADHQQANRLDQLPPTAKQELLDLYVDQRLANKIAWGVGELLQGYCPERSEDDLVEEYVAFWKSVYDLSQTTVTLPDVGLDDQQLTLEFTHKDITFSKQQLTDPTSDLLHLFQLDFEIDTTKSTVDPAIFTTGRYQYDTPESDTMRLDKQLTTRPKQIPDDFDTLQMLYFGCLTMDNSPYQFVEEGREEEFGGAAAPSVSRQSDEAVAPQEAAHEITYRDLFRASFTPADEIPPEIRAVHDDDVQINAWIDAGKIHYNATVFAEKFGISVGENAQGRRTFQLDGEQPAPVISWAKGHQELRKQEVLPWLKQQKRHEVTHRLLHFHGIDELTVTATDGRSVTLSQEELCQIADGRYDDGNRETVTLPGAGGEEITYRYTDIEAAIQAAGIDGFSFQEVRKLDAKHFAAYQEHPENFAGLRATSAGTSMKHLLDNINTNVTDLKGMAKKIQQSQTLDSSPKIKQALQKVKQLKHKITTNLDARSTATKQAKEKFDKELINGFQQIFDAVIDYIQKVEVELEENSRLSRAKKDEYQQKLAAKRHEIAAYGNKLLPLLDAWTDENYENEQVQKTANQLKQELVPKLYALTKQALEDEQTSASPNPDREADLQDLKDELDERATQQQEEEIAQEHQREDEEVGKNFKKFKSRFSQLKGDNSADYEPGTVLFLRVQDSRSPGRASVWIEAEITDADEQQFTLRATGSTELDDGGMTKEEATKRFAATPDDLGKLISQSKGEIYKFKKQSSAGELYSYLTDSSTGLNSSTTKLNERRGAWSEDKIQDGFIKKYFEGDTKKADKITHIGRTTEQMGTGTKGRSFFYKVNFENNGVRVALEGGGFEKLMSYNSFLMFTMDKDLRPYTATEVKNIQSDTPDAKEAPSLLNWISPNAFMKGLNKFMDSYKYKLEQREKYQAAKFYYGMTRWMPESRGYKGEAASELDSKITEVIKSYKNRLGRGDDGSDVHGSRVAQTIEKEIFLHMGSSTKFRQKAAGYYLYALQEGGSAYFRSLHAYAHKGMWTRAILGPGHQKAYLAERKKLVDKLKSEGTDKDAALDELARHEVRYIAKNAQDDKYITTFGTRFGRRVEDEATDLGQASKAAGKKEGLSKKGNIYEVYDAFRHGGIGNLNTQLVIGGLQAMEEKVLDMSHYSLFYKSIIQLLITGYGLRMNTNGRDQIKDVCRRRGIPIGLLIGEATHPYKVVKIIDHIAQSSEGSNTPFPTLTSAIQSKYAGWTGEDVSAFNVAKDGRHKEIMDVIDKRWDNYGHLVIGAFNYKNTRLLGYSSEADDETKPIIQDYVEKGIFNPYKGSLGRQADAGDPQSPFVQQGILNVSAGFFDRFMLKFDNTGHFTNPEAYDMREQFNGILGQLGSVIKNTDNPKDKRTGMSILIRKFTQYFDRFFAKDDLAKLEQACIAGRTETVTVGKNDVAYGYASLIRHHVLGDPMTKKETYVTDQGEKKTRVKKRERSRSRRIEEPIVRESIENFIRIINDVLQGPGDNEQLIKHLFTD